MAAKVMGYRVYALDPDSGCPAHSVVDKCFTGAWDDTDAASRMAENCDVVTLEIEQISIRSLRAVQQFSPLRPNADSIYTIQNRIRQKEWLVHHGFPVGSYSVVERRQDCAQVVEDLGCNVFVKRSTGGYDGKSQTHLINCNSQMLTAAWEELGCQPCIVESALVLDCEISVMVARSPNGEVKVFPAARNHHEKQILFWSALPASISRELETMAQLLAIKIANAFSYEGVLAVEMFITGEGQLLVNELAPRPHNSYHASERACATSQFEQAVRAVCNLPLGDVTLREPAAITNLLGDLWLDQKPHFERALRHAGVRLHLYQKAETRKGRKMGHLSSIGHTAEDAVERAIAAYRALTENV